MVCIYFFSTNYTSNHLMWLVGLLQWQRSLERTQALRSKRELQFPKPTPLSISPRGHRLYYGHGCAMLRQKLWTGHPRQQQQRRPQANNCDRFLAPNSIHVGCNGKRIVSSISNSSRRHQRQKHHHGVQLQAFSDDPLIQDQASTHEPGAYPPYQ